MTEGWKWTLIEYQLCAKPHHPQSHLTSLKLYLLSQWVVKTGLLDIPGAPSMTPLISLVMLTSLLSSDTALATILNKAQTLWHRKLGHIWEALLGKAPSSGQSLWVSSVESELNDLIPHLPPPCSPWGPTSCGLSVELLVWRRQR